MNDDIHPTVLVEITHGKPFGEPTVGEAFAYDQLRVIRQAMRRGNRQLVGRPDKFLMPIDDNIDWGPPWSLPQTGEFRIWRHSFGSDAKFRVVCSPAANAFYRVLYRGSSPGDIRTPVDVSDPEHNWWTPLRPHSAFYRVQQIPIAQPIDSDGDGIDDVYELRHSGFLNPLNASDAAEDFDGDGRPNLEEYRDATDPEMP